MRWTNTWNACDPRSEKTRVLQSEVVIVKRIYASKFSKVHCARSVFLSLPASGGFAFPFRQLRGPLVGFHVEGALQFHLPSHADEPCVPRQLHGGNFRNAELRSKIFRGTGE